jgi:diguanylate cyclase (GGDEF)-like protein/PAS domain S-box-containing protein
MTKIFLPLRMQAVLFFLLVHAALFVAVFGVIGVWLLHSFTALETTQTNATLRQALNAIEDEVRELDTATGDWAAWDDLVSFVQAGDKGFIQRNLPTEAMHTLKLNAVLILDARGETVYARFLDLDNDSNLTLPGTLAGHVAPGGLLTRHDNNKYSLISGSLLLNATTCLLVSSRPILTTNREGAIHGTLIMARLLTPSLLTALSAKLQLPLSMMYGGASDLSPDGKAYFAALKAAAGIHIHRISETQLVGVGLLPDIEGKKGAALRVELPRSTYAEGRRLYRLFAAAFLLAFVLLQFASALFFERRILSRLARLTRTVTHIAAAADASERVPVAGRDEIAQLATDFNQMMDSLELTRQRLMEDEARLTAILDTAAEGIITMDETGAIVSFNRAAEGIFGRTAAAVRGKSTAALLAPFEGVTAEDRLMQYLGLADDRGLRGAEVAGRRGDGSVFPMSLSVSRAVTHGGGSQLTVIVRDITDEKQHLDMLEIAAAQDPLTQLLNRSHFEEHLQDAIYSAQRYKHALSLIMCDVDHFKGVNDTHGHAAGDEVLRFFSQSVRAEIRVNDFAGRYGGDEFCFALFHAGSDQAGACIERICRRMREHAFLGADGTPFTVTVSYGVAGLGESATTVGEFFAQADQALYEAKVHGRNRYWVG